MSGRITDPPIGIGDPDYFLGICDGCCSLKAFTTARGRDQWEMFHPHEWDTPEN
jgi:hypothetical protein